MHDQNDKSSQKTRSDRIKRSSQLQVEAIAEMKNIPFYSLDNSAKGIIKKLSTGKFYLCGTQFFSFITQLK